MVNWPVPTSRLLLKACDKDVLFRYRLPVDPAGTAPPGVIEMLSTNTPLLNPQPFLSSPPKVMTLAVGSEVAFVWIRTPST